MGPPPVRPHPDASSSAGGGLRRDRSRSPPGPLVDRVTRWRIRGAPGALADQVSVLVGEVTALRGEFDERWRLARIGICSNDGDLSARIDRLVDEVLALRTSFESHLPAGR